MGALKSGVFPDQEVKLVGEHGNLWNNEEVVYDGESSIVDTKNLPNISIMVNIFSDEANTSTAQGTVNFNASANGDFWTFCTQITDNLPQGSSHEAHVFHTIGARYVKLVRADTDSDPNVWITATLQAKP